MPISNISSGIRTGVCTSTTRPTTPYEGQMIYETDTNRVLVWDNAAWVMIANTDTPPALSLITPTSVAGTNVSISGATITLSGTTAANINGCFTSEFNNYRIVISNTTMSTSGSYYMRLRTSSDSTTTYYYAGPYRFYAAAGGGDTFGNNTSQWILGTPNATIPSMAVVDVCSPNLNAFTTFQALCTNWDTMINVGGNHQTSTAYTGFSIISNTATTISGTIRVYGYRN